MAEDVKTTLPWLTPYQQRIAQYYTQHKTLPPESWDPWDEPRQFSSDCASATVGQILRSGIYILERVSRMGFNLYGPLSTAWLSDDPDVEGKIPSVCRQLFHYLYGSNFTDQAYNRIVRSTDANKRLFFRRDGALVYVLDYAKFNNPELFSQPLQLDLLQKVH